MATMLMGVFAGVAQASSVINPAASDSPPSDAAGARTVYTVSFTTSSTGGLSGAANSQITITLPSGSSTSTIVGSSVLDTSTGNNQVGDCFAQGGSTTIEICDIFNGSTVNAGDGVKVVLDGVTNPPVNPTGSPNQTLFVQTTSDSTPVGAGYPVVAGQRISEPLVSVSPPSNGAGARTDLYGVVHDLFDGWVVGGGEQPDHDHAPVGQ